MALEIEPNGKMLDVIDALAKIPGSKPVSPENIHVTMKFLGEVKASRLQEITDAACAACAGFEPFQAELKGVGVFAHPGKARVFWLGLEPADRMKSLAGKIDEEMSHLGFEREKRDFSAHVTLARFRKRPRPGHVKELLEKWDKESFGSQLVDGVAVKKSTLTPRGPIYETVGTARLGARK